MPNAAHPEPFGWTLPGEESRMIVRRLDQEQVDVLASAPAQQREPAQLPIIVFVRPQITHREQPSMTATITDYSQRMAASRKGFAGIVRVASPHDGPPPVRTHIGT
jgi:hypothetical protein